MKTSCTNQLGIKVGVRRGKKEGVTPPANTPFYKQASEQIVKDDVIGFSSTSGICSWR
jgi:hypothetical protein